VVAFERDTMLGGLVAQGVKFDFALDPNLGGMLPADLDEATPPPDSYLAAANHDPDGDSNDTTITVPKP
jgi:hypothetical protein